MWRTYSFRDVHGLFQALFVHREFDGDMRQGSIHLLVWIGTNGRVIPGIFMILGYRSDPEDGLSRQWR